MAPNIAMVCRRWGSSHFITNHSASSVADYVCSLRSARHYAPQLLPAALAFLRMVNRRGHLGSIASLRRGLLHPKTLTRWTDGTLMQRGIRFTLRCAHLYTEQHRNVIFFSRRRSSCAALATWLPTRSERRLLRRRLSGAGAWFCCHLAPRHSVRITAFARLLPYRCGDISAASTVLVIFTWHLPMVRLPPATGAASLSRDSRIRAAACRISLNRKYRRLNSPIVYALNMNLTH